MKKNYRTILQESNGIFKDRGSKFFAFAFPIVQEQTFKDHLQQIKKVHAKARHFCFAYRIGLEGNQYRYNDDGEPSGTAGKPILGAIDKYDLTNVLIIVVRYFGGTKLGTSGLINAYKESALDALGQAKMITKKVMAYFQIEADYMYSAKLMQLLNHLPCKIIGTNYDALVLIKVSAEVAFAHEFVKKIKAVIADKYEEEITGDIKIEGLDIKQLYIR